MAKTDIGPKISIDGEPEYRKQINNLIQQAKTLDSEMRAVTSAFNENTSAAEKAAAKSNVLNKQIDVQKQKIEQLRVMVEKSAGMYGETATETMKWKQKLNDATASMNNMEKELRDTSKGMDDLERNTEESAKEMRNLERNAQGVGNELDGAGKSAGSFGSTLKAVLTSEVIMSGVRLLADAAKALGKAMIDLTKQSLTAYAEYEQLSGGIASLFSTTSMNMEEYVGNMLGDGKTLVEAERAWAAEQAAVTAIMNDADEAFRTAAVSRNKYQEAATTFAAPLINALDGDMMEASDLVNMALTDISDNINRFGGEFDDAMQAYAGFAKGQWTLLDNLKLGYAGTAEGVAKLINESGVLEGKLIDLSKKNELNAQIEAAGGLPTVIKAIHAKQEELNIAGTTLKEAATTITGSANMVKAAWENVLISIGSGDASMLNQDIENLASSVLTLADNALPRLKEIMSGIGTFIGGIAPMIAQELPALLTDVLPTLIDSALTLAQTLLTTVVSALPGLMQQLLPMTINLLDTILLDVLPQVLTVALQLVQMLAMGIAQAAPTLIPTAIEVVIGLCNALVSPDGLAAILDAAVALLQGLKDGILAALPIWVESAPIIIGELASTLIQFIPEELVPIAYEILWALAGGLYKNVPVFAAGMLNVMFESIDQILKIDWIGTGKNIIAAVTNGIIGAATDLLNGVETALAPTQKWFKTLIGDGKGWGSDMIHGFIDGIRSVRRKLENAVADVAKLIREYLHFSRPDKGPLRDYETYMPHMIQGMVKGIEDNKYKLRNAVSGMAGDVALAASNGAHINNRSVNVGAPIINVYGRDGQSVDELADAVAYKLHNTVERREIAWA